MRRSIKQTDQPDKQVRLFLAGECVIHFGARSRCNETMQDALRYGASWSGVNAVRHKHVSRAMQAVKGTTSIEDAIAIFAHRVPVCGVEHVNLSQSLYRVLAEDITAPRPIPEQDKSAMDGYAFRLSDLPLDGRMPISGRAAAGHPFQGTLPPRTAIRIFTGGVIPEGADTVAMQEDCSLADGMIVLPTTLKLGANRRSAGEDVVQNATVLTRGTRLRPQDIGIAAAVGRPTLLVHRRIRVAVIATGDELRAPGEPLPRGCIYDTNRPTITAALRALSVEVTDYGLIPDKMPLIRDALAAAARDNDLVMTSGGVSVGEEDHVRSAVQEIGSLDFWKLPIKPGRPVAMGQIAGVPYIGLPGNPVSAMVIFWLIARPLILRLMGAGDLSSPRFQVVSAFSHTHAPGRREFLRARVSADVFGIMRAEVYPSTSSGVLSSMTWSDGFVEIHESTGDVNVGDVLPYLPYSTLSA
jgi:molybdopterin molybdotransferase